MTILTWRNSAKKTIMQWHGTLLSPSIKTTGKPYAPNAAAFKPAGCVLLLDARI
jgi:hypothetical protein